MKMECTRVKLALTCLGLITIVLIQILYISSKLGGNCDIKEIFLQYNVGVKYDVKSIEIPAIDRRRRLPDALIIGVRKGGTRALLDAMALHPSIKAARREVHFFDQNETYSQGIEWYRQQMPFSHPGQLTVEKTPAYFASTITPSRVHELNKNMKLIVILRDPVIRTISDFTQVLYTKLERNKTQPIFENVAFLPNSTKINVEFKPIRNSLYYLHLKNWLQYFPLENFLFLNGEKFVNNPLSENRSINCNYHGYQWQSFQHDIYIYWTFNIDSNILFNYAGIVSGKKLFDNSGEMMIETMDFNTISLFFTAITFLSKMLESNSSHIVTLASMAGKSGITGLVDYWASKFGVVTYSMNTRLLLQIFFQFFNLNMSLIDPLKQF